VSQRLPTSGVTARIVPIDGPELEAVFFLRERGAQGRTLETLGERLSEPRATFVPVEVEGVIQFVNLAAIAYVEHFGDLHELARLADMGAWRASVEIALTSGLVLLGDLVYLLPPERRRVTDLLNEDERFVLLVDDTHCRYINRAAIARVRPATDEPA
jgi:hypothetical protein